MNKYGVRLRLRGVVLRLLLGHALVDVARAPRAERHEVQFPLPRRRDLVDGDEAAAPPPAAGALRRLADWLAYAADRGGDFLPLLRAFLAMQRVRLAARLRRWSPWAPSPAAASAFDARLVVDRLVYAVGRCILLDGIFSADPHPGNVLVRENNELGLIDMGCVYRLADGERRDVALALLAIGAGDADALGRLYARITGLELRTFDARVSVDSTHWFGGSPPNFRTLYLGQIEVDLAGFWTDRSLSSSSRSTAKESGPNRSITRTLKSG